MAKVCLIVIDGWGISEETKGNAIKNAETPVMDALAQAAGEYTTLDASGFAVGLPEGLMGNSEVGHFTIGTGRVVFQGITAINKSIESRAFHSKPVLLQAFQRAREVSGGRVHFLGLVSDGGVHSHISHLEAFLEAAKMAGVDHPYVHFFSDGRDTAPDSGVTYVRRIVEYMKGTGYGKLATLIGRYYAMDRDKRYERIKLAYEGLTQGVGEKVALDQLTKVMEARYQQSPPVTDEFMTPLIINEEGLIKDNDTLVFIDFRADRMRQLVEAFGIKPQFEVGVAPPQGLSLCTMTEYKDVFPFPVLFPQEVPSNTLAEWLAKKQLPQFHCAETEKYAHVTFFFNGGLEQAHEKEERHLVPSPRVATYDLQPEMNAAGVALAMVAAMKTGTYPFVMCNFAPPDMVGHTGVYNAAVQACAATDTAIGDVQRACEENGYVMLVTADHGNAERMMDENGRPVTKHTTFRVPFCMHSPPGHAHKFRQLTHDPGLSDVAPTVLDLMGLDIPSEITGQSLL